MKNMEETDTKIIKQEEELNKIVVPERIASLIEERVLIEKELEEEIEAVKAKYSKKLNELNEKTGTFEKFLDGYFSDFDSLKSVTLREGSYEIRWKRGRYYKTLKVSSEKIKHTILTVLNSANKGVLDKETLISITDSIVLQLFETKFGYQSIKTKFLKETYRNKPRLDLKLE